MTIGDKLHDWNRVKFICAIRYKYRFSVRILNADDKLVDLSHGTHEKQDRACVCVCLEKSFISFSS